MTDPRTDAALPGRTADVVPVAELSAALDEIHRLRRALAYEAWGIDAHLSFKSFPASRRPTAGEQTERMRDAACGHSRRAYADVPAQALRSAAAIAGARQTLTRAEFAQEEGLPVDPAPQADPTPPVPGLPIESRDAIEAALLRRATEIAATAPDDPGRRLMLDCAVNDVLASLAPHLDAFADAARAQERAAIYEDTRQQLAAANAEVDRLRAALANPYHLNETAEQHQRAQGIAQGLGRVMDRIKRRGATA